MSWTPTRLIPDLGPREHRWVCAQMCGRETKLNRVLSSQRISPTPPPPPTPPPHLGPPASRVTDHLSRTQKREGSSRWSRGRGSARSSNLAGGVDGVMRVDRHEHSLPHTAPCDTGRYDSPPQCAAQCRRCEAPERRLSSTPAELLPTFIVW